jgi:hypothetical protein
MVACSPKQSLSPAVAGSTPNRPIPELAATARQVASFATRITPRSLIAQGLYRELTSASSSTSSRDITPSSIPRQGEGRGLDRPFLYTPDQLSVKKSAPKND